MSKENKKHKESFETFGQKSLAGAMYTLKSDSRGSKYGDTSLDSQKAFESLDVNKLAPPPPTYDNIEEEKCQITDELVKKNLDTDDSTDISAQVTKRTNVKNNGQEGESHQSCASMPILNLDNLSKHPVDGTLTKESQNSEISECQKSTTKSKYLFLNGIEVENPSRIVIKEYMNELTNEDRIRTLSDQDNLESSLEISEAEQGKFLLVIYIVNFNEISQFKRSKKEENKMNAKDIVDEGNNELGISSILEHSGNNNETDILEYCTPNYATNTSKLFSTKDKAEIDPPGSGKMSSGDKISVDIHNLESFSLGPNQSPTNILSTRQASQKLVEELRSLEEENLKEENKIENSRELTKNGFISQHFKGIYCKFI